MEGTVFYRWLTDLLASNIVVPPSPGSGVCLLWSAVTYMHTEQQIHLLRSSSASAEMGLAMLSPTTM